MPFSGSDQWGGDLPLSSGPRLQEHAGHPLWDELRPGIQAGGEELPPVPRQPPLVGDRLLPQYVEISPSHMRTHYGMFCVLTTNGKTKSNSEMMLLKNCLWFQSLLKFITLLHGTPLTIKLYYKGICEPHCFTASTIIAIRNMAIQNPADSKCLIIENSPL